MGDPLLDLIGRIEAAANAATPGPWEVYDGLDIDTVRGEVVTIVDEWEVARPTGEVTVDADHDATHIATADPPTVLLLCRLARAALAIEQLHGTDCEVDAMVAISEVADAAREGLADA